MNEHHYQRIDNGQKRGPKPQIDRRPKAHLAQDRAGRFLSTYPPELQAKVILECQERIANGETPEQIAARHGIPGRTVLYWLLGDEKAEQARGLLIASELARCLVYMRKPTKEELEEEGEQDGPLRLARAREEFRAWSWIAERREARLYGQKQEVTHNIQQPILNITVIQMAAQALQTPVDNSVVAEQLPQCTTPDNIPKLT